jgi:hypothetical protein
MSQAAAASHDVRVVVFRGDDVPVWVAHCLTFDVISQGETVDEAMGGINEAIGMMLRHELTAVVHPSCDCGLDPKEHRAPAAHWDFAAALATNPEVDEATAVEFPRTDDGLAVLIVDYAYPSNGAPPTFRRWVRTHTVLP